MIDRHDLDDLQQEYITLAIAEKTDDVDCSPSTMKSRYRRLTAIEELVGHGLAHSWQENADTQSAEVRYSSGKLWDQ